MSATRNDSLLALVGRLFWMMFGPVLLLVTLFMIVSAPASGWRTGADIAYGLILISMVLGRWLEYHTGTPRNSMGEPSTAAELHRYTVIAIVVGSALWVAANVVANYWLA